MPRRVLVTGASGHIGSHVVRALEREGREVRALVRPTSDLRGLQGAKAEVVKGDVLDVATLRDAVQGCDVVYHAAALYCTDPKRADDILRTAVEGTRNLYAAMGDAGGVARVVYTSSVAAIGHNYDPSRVLDESSWNDAPMDAYCQAKTDSERLAWDLARETSIPTVVVNPATVLGPNDWKPTPSNWLVLNYLQHPRPVYFDAGHCYVDVEDVARGHLLAEAKGRPGERYVLGGDNVTLRDVFESLSAMTGLARPRVKLSKGAVMAAASVMEAAAKVARTRPLVTREKAGRIVGYHSYFSSEKAERELGYEARAYGDALARTAAWFVRSGFLPPRRAARLRAHMERIHSELFEAST